LKQSSAFAFDEIAGATRTGLDCQFMRTAAQKLKLEEATPCYTPGSWSWRSVNFRCRIALSETQPKHPLHADYKLRRAQAALWLPRLERYFAHPRWGTHK
jgi:hypothetical protein